MSGLLLKDLKNLKQQGKIYLMILVLWTALCIGNRESSVFGGWMIMLALMIPITAISYDEKANWDRYALTMPISRTALVASRYALSGLCLLVGSVAYIIFALALGTEPAEVSATLMGLFSVGVVLDALMLPFYFRFGVEKGRYIMIMIILIPTVLVFLLPKSALNNWDMPDFLLPLLVLLSLGIAVASFLISRAICRGKEF